jgi:hypothetical protein
VSQIDRLRRCADREAGILMDRTDVRELLAEIDAQPDGVDGTCVLIGETADGQRAGARGGQPPQRAVGAAVRREGGAGVRTRADIIAAIMAELDRAEAKYPAWPTDQVHAAAIVAEESGELVRAVLNESYHGAPRADSDREAVQTAAMCVRFLVNR